MRAAGVPTALCALAVLGGSVNTPAEAQSIAYIQQVGQQHRAEIVQESSPSSSALIAQRGAFHDHRIAQRNGSDNYAAIDARGNPGGGATAGDAGSISQSGAHQTALTFSAGSGNDFSIDQSGGDGANLAALVQTGRRNRATVEQSNSAPPSAAGGATGASGFAAAARGLDFGGSGLASQIQGMALGSANATLQVQAGTDNTASVSQSGQGNLAIQTQIGNGNTMSGAQVGDGNTLVHTQVGNGIVGPDIVQSGHQSITITQIKP